MHENKYMVLVMEMLGEPMSKLRQSVGAEYGIPVMQCISAASQVGWHVFLGLDLKDVDVGLYSRSS